MCLIAWFTNDTPQSPFFQNAVKLNFSFFASDVRGLFAQTFRALRTQYDFTKGMPASVHRFGEISPLWQKNKVFSNSWKVYLELGKIFTLFWLRFMQLG